MKIRIALFTLLALAAIPAAAQDDDRPWRKQLSFDAGILFPGGDHGNRLETGLGFTGTFYYQLLTRYTFISLAAGYNNFEYRDPLAGVKHTVIPLLIGLRYNFTLEGFQPYIGAETGLYLRSNSRIDNTINLPESSADFGFMPKLGFRYPLAAGFDLDGSVKWHNVLSETSFSWFGLNLGLAYTIE